MKKKILIINFGDQKSIIESGLLISKIIVDEKYRSVSLLIFEEFRKAVSVLNDVDKTITIDRVSIQSIFNNKIYPKHFALNLFMEKIESIKSANFNLIVNYSRDKFANYISGYFFSNVEICGSYYSFKNNLCHSDEWSMVGDIVEETKYLSFDRNYIYGKMMGLKLLDAKRGYVVREKHEKTVEHSLNKLKALNQHEGSDPAIVGVCVGLGKKSKYLSVKMIMDLLRELKKSKGILPLIIAGTSDEDENLAKLINERFGYSLTLVKVDVIAAPSLIKGLDGLICPDDYFKYVAGLVGTRTVELSLGSMSFQGAGWGLIVTTGLNDKKNFDKSFNDKLKSSDMVKILKYVLNGENSDNLHIDPDVFVYRKERLGNEFFYEKIGEGKEGEMSIRRIMARNIIMLRFNQKDSFNKKFDYLLFHNSAKILNQWINHERKMIADLMKDILSVIRLVLQSQKDKRKVKELAYKFDGLFAREKINSPIKIPIIFLRGGIFSSDKIDFILEELYKTKNHVQKYNALIEELDRYQRKGKITQERVSGIENG